jgi:large subunit ribosomal protein L40e/small subunit ribosomal protein S27Ae
MKLYVKTLTGKTLVVDVDADATTLDVKRRIEVCESIAPERQRLIFAGRTLDDKSKLKQYNITDKCTIHLVLSLASTCLSSAHTTRRETGVGTKI